MRSGKIQWREDLYDLYKREGRISKDMKEGAFYKSEEYKIASKDWNREYRKVQKLYGKAYNESGERRFNLSIKTYQRLLGKNRRHVFDDTGTDTGITTPSFDDFLDEIVNQQGKVRTSDDLLRIERLFNINPLFEFAKGFKDEESIKFINAYKDFAKGLISYKDLLEAIREYKDKNKEEFKEGSR